MREGLLHCERLLFYSLTWKTILEKIIIQLNIFDFFEVIRKLLMYNSHFGHRNVINS